MKPTILKVLSYNIHKGFSTANRHFALKAIKNSIRPLGVNLVFLQEVVGEHARHARRIKGWPAASQFEYLADQSWSHFAYGKNSVTSGGHHGNAILSEFPIIEWFNLDISSNPFENRGLLHATIEIPKDYSSGDDLTSMTNSQTIQCFCVHLSLFEGGRERQIQKISETIATHAPGNMPFILAGDFNDWRSRASDELAERTGAQEAFISYHGKHARTYPSELPLLCLDRIYLRGARVIEARTLQGESWRRLSDHLGLYAEIEVL